jgi:phosphoserine phosphatase
MQKVVFLDLDGTVTPDSTWLHFNLRLGITPEEDTALFEKYLKENLEYNDWTKELFRIHTSRGSITKGELETFAHEIVLRPDAIDMVSALKEKGWHIVLISGSVDLIVSIIASRLGADEWRACSQLVFVEDGTLADIVSSGDESNAKIAIAKKYLSEHSISLENAIAIGDGGNDIDLFKHMNGILLGQNEKLKAVAWKQVEQLLEIPNLI